MDAVPTTAQHKKVKLSRGGTLSVRRASRHDMNRLLAAVEFDPTKMYKAAQLHETAFRWGVVGSDQVVNEQGGSVPYRSDMHPLLGLICGAEIYDAVTDEEAVAVYQYVASGAELPEAMRGN